MIKYLFVLILIAFSLNHVKAQDEFLKEKYKSKIENYNRMKNTGSSLTTLGTMAAGGGVFLLVSGSKKVNGQYNTDPNFTKIYGGIILLELGVGSFVTGIVLSSVGNRKSKEYNQKLRDISFEINGQPENRGITLVYRF